MGLVLPFRGYIPHKGVPHGSKNTAWNKKSLAEMNKFKDVMALLKPTDLGAFYRSGRIISENGQWFEDIYFESDLENRPILQDLSKNGEVGSIIVIKMEDIYQKNKIENELDNIVYLSLLERIAERAMPVISIGSGSASMSNSLMNKINTREETNYETVSNIILHNFMKNMDSINSRISQNKRFETEKQRELREKKILEY